jgi:hypothetical protein
MHSSKKEIDSILETVDVEMVIPIVAAIEVVKPNLTEAKISISQPPQSIRGARRPFKFSNDAIRLSEFADSQETLPPERPEDEIQLPFWGSR